MSWVYHTMDRTGASVNEACVSDMAAKHGVPKGNRSEGWRCMFGAAVAPFIQTPTFVLNSKYDTWQAAQIIGANAPPMKCGTDIASCPANITAFWVDYGHKMVEALDALPPRHGAYLHNCQSHCQTGAVPYDTDSINGTNMSQAVATWYAAAMQGSQELVPRHVDRCDVTPCTGDFCTAAATAADVPATAGSAPAAIPAAAVAAPVRVSCVGDSITSEPGNNMTYSAQLGRLLGPGYEVTNQGVSVRLLRHHFAHHSRSSQPHATPHALCAVCRAW